MSGRLSPISLTEQIACVEREIAMRKRVYPRWVASDRMTQQKADDEILAMQAVRDTLVGLRASRDPYREDDRRLNAGLTCGKCGDYHAPGRCPACD